MEKMVCWRCASAFLNAAALIQIVRPDGNLTEFEPRGYPTIREVQESLREIPGSYLRINMQEIRSSMTVEVLVNGSGVCLEHTDAEVSDMTMHSRRRNFY